MICFYVPKGSPWTVSISIFREIEETPQIKVKNVNKENNTNVRGEGITKINEVQRGCPITHLYNYYYIGAIKETHVSSFNGITLQTKPY